MMVIDMGNTTPIIDGIDDDFTVIEADDDYEGYSVSVSQFWNGPWSALGSGFGNTSFDLNDVGLETARFVKIEDDGTLSDLKDYPGFDLDAIQTQKELNQLNDKGPLYFCGAYFKYGFHEDGFTAGINVARKIAGDEVWQ